MGWRGGWGYLWVLLWATDVLEKSARSQESGVNGPAGAGMSVCTWRLSGGPLIFRLVPNMP